MILLSDCKYLQKELIHRDLFITNNNENLGLKLWRKMQMIGIWECMKLL